MSTKTSTINEEVVAREYVEYLVARGIAELGPSARLTEISDSLGIPELEADNLRVLLATNPNKFIYGERRWGTISRTFGHSVPMNEVIRKILSVSGGPLSIKQIATQLEATFGRPAEIYEEQVERFVKSSPHLFVTESGIVGCTEWIFCATDENEEKALFINDLDNATVAKWKKYADDLDWHNPESALEFINKAKKIVPNKIIGYFAWKHLNPSDPYASMHYNAVKLFETVYNSNDYIFAQDGAWHKASEKDKWLKKTLSLLETLADTVEIEESAPLEISPADLEQAVTLVMNNEEFTSAQYMLENLFEVLKSSSTYQEDLHTLITVLRSEDRIKWVGGDRFRTPETEPPYVATIPEILNYNQETSEDNDVDIELVDEGFSSSLRKEIHHPLAQDVLDEDPNLSGAGAEANELRCVLKTNHHEIGTFPLCQVPYGFLPTDPELVELTFVNKDGRKLNVWLNNQTRLIYGLFEWYIENEIESGAVFYLRKTDDPCAYEFEWATDSDPLIFITPNRMEELRNMQSRADTMSLFEIITEIIEKHNKGIDFLTILAELNVVKRTKRRIAASVLSAYPCFTQHSGSPLWHYDPKKVKHGFEKTKKRFIKDVRKFDDMTNETDDESDD